ncbi:MAG: hypothetical protein WC306_03555 [Candidatus Paceibacterota bacterium]|jgi:hypothetical protein
METKNLLLLIATIAIAVFIAFGTFSYIPGLKDQIKTKEAEYSRYKDSTTQVMNALNVKLDSLAKEKNKIIDHIVNVPVYVSELSKESDSTIAVKVDSVFLRNVDTSTKKDSAFKSMAVTVNTEQDSLSGIFVHKFVAIDYLATYDLMLSYKSLTQMNQKEIGIWIQKYDIEKTLREKSESLNFDYKTLVNNQEKQIRTYRSIAIGGGCAGSAAILKGTPTEIVLSGVGGFAVSYLYSWIF